MSGMVMAVFAAAGGLRPVEASQLCVTLGSVDDAGGRLSVQVPKFRAVAPGSSGRRAALRLEVQGNTAREERLGSGAMRRQLGLKLLAKNGCNLLYVMWRVEPVQQLVVQVKLNPGMETHAQCGNRGYRTLKPRLSAPPPRLLPGEPHLLEAALTGSDLEVKIDGAVVWAGPADVGDLQGPAGLRSDNLRFNFSLQVDGAPAPGGPRCMAGDE